MRFEPLRYEHLAQMAQIEREAFDQPWSVNMFIPEVEDKNAHYIVGTRGDEVICYGGFHKVLDEAHITNIAVKDTNRGKGIGRLLLGQLIDDARRNDINYMTLEVKDGNMAAIKLYQSYGFKVAGVRKKYYNNQYDALIMWLSIGDAQ